MGNTQVGPVAQPVLEVATETTKVPTDDLKTLFPSVPSLSSVASPPEEEGQDDEKRHQVSTAAPASSRSVYEVTAFQDCGDYNTCWLQPRKSFLHSTRLEALMRVAQLTSAATATAASATGTCTPGASMMSTAEVEELERYVIDAEIEEPLWFAWCEAKHWMERHGRGKLGCIRVAVKVIDQCGLDDPQADFEGEMPSNDECFVYNAALRSRVSTRIRELMDKKMGQASLRCDDDDDKGEADVRTRAASSVEITP